MSSSTRHGRLADSERSQSPRMRTFSVSWTTWKLTQAGSLACHAFVETNASLPFAPLARRQSIVEQNKRDTLAIQEVSSALIHFFPGELAPAGVHEIGLQHREWRTMAFSRFAALGPRSQQATGGTLPFSVVLLGSGNAASLLDQPLIGA